MASSKFSKISVEWIAEELELWKSSTFHNMWKPFSGLLHAHKFVMGSHKILEWKIMAQMQVID